MKNINKKARRWIEGFGLRVRGERKARGLTLADVADVATMHWRHWQKIEAGESNPCMVTLFKIALALGMHPATLLEAD